MRSGRHATLPRLRAPRHPWISWAGGAVLGSTVAVVSCGSRPFAEGSSRELTVVSSLPADSPELLVLRAIVERTAIRIDDEKAYVMTVVPPSDPRAYRARNVVVVGYGDAARVPAPARRLYAIMGEATTGVAGIGAAAKSNAHELPFAFGPDHWLRGQAAGIIWTSRREEWIPAVTALQNRLFQGLDRATFAAVRERVLSLPRDAAAEQELEDALGITMRVPRGMKLRVDRGAKAALLYEAGPPARLLRITVSPGSAGAGGDTRRARAALARRFRPDERTLDVAEPLLTPDIMAGATRQLHGRWEDAAVSAAGPFRYYEVARGTMRYQVDLAVFAPGRPKLPYLRELHAIAETATPRE
jgi:hypothetical protein